jgi:hypothetical protein
VRLQLNEPEFRQLQLRSGGLIRRSCPNDSVIEQCRPNT